MFLGDKGTVRGFIYGRQCFLDGEETVAILQTLRKPTPIFFIFRDEKTWNITAILTKLDANTRNKAPLIQTETGRDTKNTVI